MKVQKYLKQCWEYFKKNYFSVIVVLALVMLLIMIIDNRDIQKIKGDDITETVKISVSVLISMLGFSVSIYVFLNNTFQNRKNGNELEMQIIDLFQKEKKRALGISIIYSFAAILTECLILINKEFVLDFVRDLEKQGAQTKQAYIYMVILGGVLIITLINIYKLAVFTYGVINYEDGMKKLAKKEIGIYDTNNCYQKISKGEFLNLVNNIEVLVERLIQNHMHAKISTANDTNLKRAICDGITEAGELNTRENLARDYKEIITYRNLLLQETSITDSTYVAMGDQVRSVMNRLFQNYLKNELLTEINISNIKIVKANLEKTSFSNSSLQGIQFVGKANLLNADFRDSTINGVIFENAECENINFSNCKLIDVKFNVNMKLQRAIFANADLSGMGDIGPEDKEGALLKFEHANFKGANLTHQDIYNVCFDFADLTNTRFMDSKIGISAQKDRNVTFKYANMERADLIRCIIERCDFMNASLNHAVFTYGKIRNVNFAECKLNDANFAEGSINNCDFEKTYCTNFSMKGAIVTNTRFTYAIMASADMSGAEFRDACFNDAVCRNTLWIRIHIEKASFERCVLANARIVGDSEKMAHIERSSFIYADLSNSAIANIEFCNCDFSEADFSRARLINVRFIDCKNLDTVITEGLWAAKVSYGGSCPSKLRKGEYEWRYGKEEENNIYENSRCNLQ